jgi:hypothetical protein
VFDFVEFLVQRNQGEPQAAPTLADSSLAAMMAHPIQAHPFTPLSRNEVNAR